MKKGTKFKLSKELFEEGIQYFNDIDIEYEYTISDFIYDDNEDPIMATVTWMEDDGEHSVNYTIEEVNENFKNSDWIVI